MRDKIHIVIIFITIGLIASSGFQFVNAQENENWLRWRGNNGNGISLETGWNPKAIKNVKIIWQKNIGKGHSCLAIKGNHIYTMGNKKNKDIVSCLNMQNGKVIWHYTYACKGGSFAGPRATPVIDGDLLYTFSRNGHLFCFYLKTGKVKWKRNLVTEFSAKNLMHGFSASPYIYKYLVILNIGEHGMAFDKTTGKVVWKSDAKKACGYATPVLFQYKKKDYIALFTGSSLYAIEPVTGKVFWSFPWKTQYELNAADPIFSQGKVFISSFHACGLFDISTGKPKLIWQKKNMKNLMSTSILLNGYLYGYDGTTQAKAFLKCVEYKTGKEMWSKKANMAH